MPATGADIPPELFERVLHFNHIDYNGTLVTKTPEVRRSLLGGPNGRRAVREANADGLVNVEPMVQFCQLAYACGT